MKVKEIIYKIQQLQNKFYELTDYQIDNNPFGDVITHFQSYLFESAKIEAVGEDSYEWTVFIDGDELSFYLSEGEPEDMIFGRNLNDTYSIAKMLKAAYDAGKRDEKLEYVFERNKDE